MKRSYITIGKVLGIIGIIPLLIPFGPLNVQAAALTALSDTMTTQKKSTAANHTILFTTPTGVASGQTIIITFQSDFSVHASLDYTDIDVADDGSEVTLAAAPSGATWGAVRTSGTVITLTNGTTPVAAGSVIRVRIGTNAVTGTTGDQQITNPTTAATFSITLSGTFTDTGTITVPILDDDQVSVSASVDQTLSFSISDNTIGFGTLSTGSSRYATGDTTGTTSEGSAHNLLASTNATSGYSVAVSGATLSSGANSIDAIAAGPTALSAGTEQFGIRSTASGGSGTVSSPFNGSAGNYGFGTSPLSSVAFASASAPSATTTYAVNYAANIAALTPAGSYTTTLTYVATANF